MTDQIPGQKQYSLAPHRVVLLDCCRTEFLADNNLDESAH